MKGRVHAAGWPFAGLLALDATRGEPAGTVPVRGLIVQIDGQSGFVVVDSGDGTHPLATDASTLCYGVDGYPIARGDIHAGDTVEAVPERHGEEWVTRKIRVLRLSSSSSRDTC